MLAEDKYNLHSRLGFIEVTVLVAKGSLRIVSDNWEYGYMNLSSRVSNKYMRIGSSVMYLSHWIMSDRNYQNTF